MRPDQLELIVRPSSPAVHPDGTWAITAVSRPSFAADDYVGQLWRVPLDGAPASRFTRGRHDTSPQFSPDGSVVAFLRPDADGRPQVHVVESTGGEPVQVTDQRMGVSEFCFSPDSRQLAFTGRVADEGRYGSLDGVTANQESPRHMTGIDFRHNGVGYTTDKQHRLFVLTLPALDAEPFIEPVGREKKAAGADADESTASGRFPAATQLTDDLADVWGPVFSADGQHVLFASARHETRDTDLRGDVFQVPVSGGEPTALSPGGTLAVSDPVVSGDHVYALCQDVGESGIDFIGSLPHVVVLDGGSARRLGDADVAFHEIHRGPGGTALVIGEQRGLRVLYRADAGSGTLTALPVEGSVLAATGIPGSTDLLAVFSDEEMPGELARIGATGDVTVLTDFTASLREQTDPIRPQELVSTTADGQQVQGWVFTPRGEGPHPTLLVIHGGPAAAYGPSWFDEAQVYASAGYGVVMCNPRGSDGYGAEHTRSIKGAFGDRDMADILGFLDHALATVPGLDADRVGVMGGSYGGYMTAWIISHDHRWKGAIVERGFLDPWSFVGSSDIGWFFSLEYNGAEGLDPRALKAHMDAQSPMLLTDQVTTPTFVIHSEQDLRCPLGQGLQYYTQLKLGGTEAEMLIFPGENHELSRSGTPWHRRERFEAILDWWQRHLPVA